MFRPHKLHWSLFPLRHESQFQTIKHLSKRGQQVTNVFPQTVGNFKISNRQQSSIWPGYWIEDQDTPATIRTDWTQTNNNNNFWFKGKKRLNTADFISISCFATVQGLRFLWWWEAGTTIPPVAQPSSLSSWHMLWFTSHVVYIWSVFCCRRCAWTQQFHYDFQLHYSLNTFAHALFCHLSARDSHYSAILLISHAIHFTLAFPFLVVGANLAQPLIPPPTTRSRSPGCRFGARTAMRVLEGSRWRRGMPGRRRRGPSASRGGCHGNRRSQPAIVVLIGRRWREL